MGVGQDQQYDALEKDEMKRGRLSILVPTYNNVEDCKTKLGEVAAQTYESIQVVVVDDGSALPVSESLLEILPSHIEARMVRHEENKGFFEAVKTGGALMDGEFVYLSSCNDPIAPDFFEQSIKALNLAPSVAYAFGDPGTIEGWGGTPRPYPLNLSASALALTPDEFVDLQRERPFHVSSNTVVYRSAPFWGCGGYREEFDLYADIFTTYFLALLQGCVYLPGVRAYSRNHDGGISKIPLSINRKFSMIRHLMTDGFGSDEVVTRRLKRSGIISSFGLHFVMKALYDRGLRDLITCRCVWTAVVRCVWGGAKVFVPRSAAVWVMKKYSSFGGN